MKVSYRLSKKGRKLSERIIVYEVMARLHTGDIDQYAKTNVFVPQSFYDKNGNKKVTFADGTIIIPKIQYADEEQVKIRQILVEAKERLKEIDSIVGKEFDRLLMEKRVPPKGWLQKTIDGQGKEQETNGQTLIEVYTYYIKSDKNKLSQGTMTHYNTMLHILERYEANRKVTLTLDNLSPDILHDLADFIREEKMKSKKNEDEEEIKIRSKNYIITLYRKFRTFIRWANGLSKKWLIEPLTTNNPFDRYDIGTELYGTPFYLTIDERNKLMAFDFPPRLAIQRDIFVFHCLVGCRISDLWARKKDDIIDGALEYIPRKTKDGMPITVRVPLNRQAQAIVERYKDNGDTRLFPFVAQQQYNEDIKEMLRLAGIKRVVTILDPKTRQEVKKPIYEVASSHMARRTFIGCLYEQGFRESDICSMSGHREGSLSIQRYRRVSDERKRLMIDSI